MVKGITYILANDTDVQALVGRNKAGDKFKVYPVIAPASEVPPFIVVVQTGKVPVECKGYPTTQVYTYDVYSYHNNYDSAEALDAAVCAALERNEGMFNGVEFQEIRRTNTIDSSSVDAETQVYAKISSFESMVNEDQIA